MSEFNPQLKLLHHPEPLRAFLNGDWKATPVQVEISPTNSCNAKCDWCFYVSSSYKQKHSEEEIEWSVLKDTLDSLNELGCKTVTWTGGGDPSTYSHIDEAIAYADSLGFSQGIFTNAYKPLAEPHKLDWIRVTITEKFTITKHVAAYANATKTGINFNICKQNESMLGKLLDEARLAKVHYFQIRPALADTSDMQEPVDCPLWARGYERLKNNPPFRVEITDYKWKEYREPHGYPTCHGHRFVPFVWHNGDVAVCAYHFGKEEFTFGNLNDSSFKDIWTGARRYEMIRQGVGVVEKCQHCCKLHEVNKSLAVLSYEVNSADDVEFL